MNTQMETIEDSFTTKFDGCDDQFTCVSSINTQMETIEASDFLKCKILSAPSEMQH